MCFLFFCNIEFKFIIYDYISSGTSNKNCSEQSSQTSTISFGEADSVLRTGIWVYDCCLLFTTNALQWKCTTDVHEKSYHNPTKKMKLVFNKETISQRNKVTTTAYGLNYTQNAFFGRDNTEDFCLPSNAKSARNLYSG